MLALVYDNWDKKSNIHNGFHDDLSAKNLLLHVCAQRYLGPRLRVPKDYGFLRMVLPYLDEDRWRQEIRMSKDAFCRLADNVATNKVFHNQAFLQQKPVELQLMVALYRLGGYGGNASIGKIASHFWIAEGTVELYTCRAMAAILSLEKQLVKWPNTQEKLAIKERIFEKAGFPNCIGFVDGTLVVLEKRPTMAGSDYFSHKSKYGLSTQVVCDDQRRIINVFAGFCGSAHDNRVFKHSRLHVSPDLFFQHGEYILADSGYTSTANVVSCFKKPPLASLNQEKEQFNKILASTRVVNEHCIGMLKGRFQCLKRLRVVIRDKHHHKRAVYYIRTCVVLHNFLLNDYYDEDWNEDEDVNDENNPASFDVMKDSGEESVDGKEKRTRICNAVLSNNGLS